MATQIETNTEIIKKGYKEFVVDANFDNIDELIADSFVGHYAGFPEVRGKEGFKQFLTMWTAAFSDREITIEDAIDEGDRVALRITFAGTHTGELNGIPPTGKRISMSGMEIFRLAGGLAAEQWAVSDNMGLMMQLGVIPTPGQ